MPRKINEARFERVHTIGQAILLGNHFPTNGKLANNEIALYSNEEWTQWILEFDGVGPVGVLRLILMEIKF